MVELGLFSGVLSIFSLIGIFSSIIGLVMFILKAFSLYEMSKSLGIKNAFLSFVPIVSVFAFGKVAEKYEKKDGSKSAKFGTLLLIFNILQYILLIVFIVLVIIAAFEIYDFAEVAVLEDSTMELSMFASVVPVIICYFALFAISVAVTVLQYVAFWRICGIFDNNNATLFTILSVVFSFLMPIFLFVIRKNKPVLLYTDKTNFEEA